jgi:hypothetical protein
MFFLIGPVNYQICPAEIERIGMIFMTGVQNNELRCLNIYHKISLEYKLRVLRMGQQREEGRRKRRGY